MTAGPITREQALGWNPRWSVGDIRRIEESFDRLGTRRYYTITSGGYVGCVDDAGRLVMNLCPGYVEFKPGLAPADSEHQWGFGLSTFNDRSEPTIRATRNEPCPICGVILPLTEVCENAH